MQHKNGIDILKESDILKKEKLLQIKTDFKGGENDGKIFKTNGNC